MRQPSLQNSVPPTTTTTTRVSSTMMAASSTTTTTKVLLMFTAAASYFILPTIAFWMPPPDPYRAKHHRYHHPHHYHQKRGQRGPLFSFSFPASSSSSSSAPVSTTTKSKNRATPTSSSTQYNTDVIDPNKTNGTENKNNKIGIGITNATNTKSNTNSRTKKKKKDDNEDIPNNEAEATRMPVVVGGGSLGAVQILEGIPDTIDSGQTIWDAGYALADLFVQEYQAQQHQQHTSVSSGFLLPRLESTTTYLELGAGTGIVGISIAAAGTTAGATLVLTDQDDMMPLLQQNIALNKYKNDKVVKALPLSWGSASSSTSSSSSSSLVRDLLRSNHNQNHHNSEKTNEETMTPTKEYFDIVCGSDILYAPDTMPLLLETLIEVSTPFKTDIVLAYKQRYCEDIFVQLVRDSGCFRLDETNSGVEIAPAVFLLRMHRI